MGLQCNTLVGNAVLILSLASENYARVLKVIAAFEVDEVEVGKMPLLAQIPHMATSTKINEFKMLLTNYNGRNPDGTRRLTSRSFKAGININGILVREEETCTENPDGDDVCQPTFTAREIKDNINRAGNQNEFFKTVDTLLGLQAEELPFVAWIALSSKESDRQDKDPSNNPECTPGKFSTRYASCRDYAMAVGVSEGITLGVPTVVQITSNRPEINFWRTNGYAQQTTSMMGEISIADGKVVKTFGSNTFIAVGEDFVQLVHTFASSQNPKTKLIMRLGFSEVFPNHAP